jgi:hypothetical protein
MLLAVMTSFTNPQNKQTLAHIFEPKYSNIQNTGFNNDFNNKLGEIFKQI